MSYARQGAQSARDLNPWDEPTPVLDGFPWLDLEPNSRELETWLQRHEPNESALRLRELNARFERRLS